MSKPTNVTFKGKPPKNYKLAGAALRTATVRVVRFGRTKSPRRTIAAFVLAAAISVGIWVAILTGYFAVR